MAIEKKDRTTETLKSTVKKLFKVFKATEDYICSRYPELQRFLPEEISFITTQELDDMYPNLTPKEREDAAVKEMKAVFIMNIGSVMKSGIKHDGRAPDYDDWTLNGDIVFWNPVLQIAFEVSSMGIRVDEDALLKQLKLAGCEDRKNLKFHRDLLNGELPYSIGGGLGQSRICMFFLGKAHVGEVQSSVWPDDMVKACENVGINLL
jgi:aspartate--ammonia ligase